MASTPKVSVLIPTYNYARYLDEAIQSVLDQTFDDYELIIVDNHSPDNTDEVIQKYLGDPRISYYKNSVNIGLIANFNKCLHYAKGDYIKFLLSDDKFHPQVLEKFVTVMDQYSNLAFVSSYRQMFGLKTKIKTTPLVGVQDGKKVSLRILKEGNWLGEPTCVMFRRKHVEIVGNFVFNSYWVTEWDLWLKLLTLGDCYIFSEPLTHIRLQPQQISRFAVRHYINYIDEYRFYKKIKEKNEYNVDLVELNIDEIVRKKAVSCTNLMVKLIPKLYQFRNIKPFFKVFKIALQEKLILTTLLEMMSRKVHFPVWKRFFKAVD